MSLVPALVLGVLGVWALVSRGPDDGAVTRGTAKLQPGQRYRFTYRSTSPVTLVEAAELMEPHQVTGLAVTVAEPGWWLLTFEAMPTSPVDAVIGTPLDPERPTIVLNRVERL